jgi:hypothetical protein
VRLLREPAQLLGLVAAVIQLGSATFLHLSIAEQGATNAVAVAVLGFVTALAVSAEKAAAAVSGLVQAIIACALAYGLALAPDVQSSVMVFVSAVTAFWLRTQVLAPVADDPNLVKAA